jgi:hypothetical protein
MTKCFPADTGPARVAKPPLAWAVLMKPTVSSRPWAGPWTAAAAVRALGPVACTVAGMAARDRARPAAATRAKPLAWSRFMFLSCS